MTDPTNAELIAEAQTHVTDEYITPDTSAEESLIRRLAAALEAADRRDQYAAVVEKAEDFVTRHYLDTRFGDEVLPILATTPEDALRELKADVWDEGDAARRMYVENRRAGRNVTMPRNPYREEDR